MFNNFLSFAHLHTIYRYDFKTGKTSVFKSPKVKFNLEDYIIKQVFYTSKNRTRVPMFISNKKGIKLNGKNPTYIYGYGGFIISLPPLFSVANLLWMEMGGIYAQANIRGGGKYGIEWYRQGVLDKKQNVFDVFIAALEFK